MHSNGLLKWLMIPLVLLLVFMVTCPSVQSASPVHPANWEPDAATAVSATTVPWEYISEQSEPQLIPGGLLVTVPPPLPALVTTNVGFWVSVPTWKRAVQVLSALITSTPSLQSASPLQPWKVEPPRGLPERMTTVPAG